MSEKINIPIHERAAKAAKIGVRVAGATVALIGANAAPAAASAEPIREVGNHIDFEHSANKEAAAKERRAVERSAERTIMDGRTVKVKDGLLVVRHNLTDNSQTGGFAPESEGMADTNEMGHEKQPYTTFINRPLWLKRNGHTYVGRLTRKSAEVDVKAQRWNPDTMSIQPDEDGNGEIVSVHFGTTNDVNTIEQDKAFLASGNVFENEDGTPKLVGAGFREDRD